MSTFMNNSSWKEVKLLLTGIDVNAIVILLYYNNRNNILKKLKEAS